MTVPSDLDVKYSCHEDTVEGIILLAARGCG